MGTFFPFTQAVFPDVETCRQVGIEKLLDCGQLSGGLLLSAVVLQQTIAADLQSFADVSLLSDQL